MPVRETSHKALDSLMKSGKLYTNTYLILKTLKRFKRGLTRREIEEKTGLRINQVTGRVAELLERKAIQESGTRRCRITKNIVNVVKLAGEQTWQKG